MTAGLLELSDILPPLYAFVLVWAEKVFMALAMIILVAFTIPDIRELASRVTSTLLSKAFLELLKDPSEDDKGKVPQDHKYQLVLKSGFVQKMLQQKYLLTFD